MSNRQLEWQIFCYLERETLSTSYLYNNKTMASFVSMTRPNWKYFMVENALKRKVYNVHGQLSLFSRYTRQFYYITLRMLIDPN